MDDICRTYGLRSIELADKPVFDAAFSTLARPVSEYSFANTFIWRTGEKLFWAPIEGHLCVFADGDDDLSMLYPPVGEGDLARCLTRCFEIMDDYNSRRGGTDRSRIEYASDEMLLRLRGRGLRAEPMGGDYVYETARLIDLAGSGLKSKRHAKNRFLRETDPWTEPLRAEHVADCLRLLQAWHDDAGDGTLGDGHVVSPAVIRHRRHLDTLATEEALRHFSALGMTGMVLGAGHRLVGFTLGEALTPTQFSVVIEKADRRPVGAAQYIFSEFCGRFWRDYAECNAGDDWDVPGLARTKASWRPVARLSKWTLRAEKTRTSVRIGADVGTRHPSAVTVRPAAVGDVFGIISLERQSFDGDDAFTSAQIRYLLRSPHTLSFVATVAADVGEGGEEGSSHGAAPREGDADEADTVVGWAVALLQRRAGGMSARLYSLAVGPEFRGRGVGEELVRTVLVELDGRQVGRCFLEVREDNGAARSLYEKLGFRNVKRLPGYYGDGVDGWRMLRTRAGEARWKEAGPGSAARATEAPAL